MHIKPNFWLPCSPRFPAASDDAESAAICRGLFFFLFSLLSPKAPPFLPSFLSPFNMLSHRERPPHHRVASIAHYTPTHATHNFVGARNLL